MIERFRTFAFILICYLHRLVQFVLNGFASGRFYIIESDRWLFGCSLGLETIALGGDVLLGAGGEGFAHVSVALVLLVYQVVRGCDVVVPIGFEASDRVLFFELEIVDQTLK